MRGPANPVSVVVPVFDSEDVLEMLVERLTAVLGQTGTGFEIVLVNDGSTDASWDQIVALCHGHEHVHGIDLMQNYGQHNALLAGIRAARYDTLVTLDDDLQNPPEEIPLLLDKLEEGFDVVYGRPPEDYSYGLLRRIGTRLTKLALRIAIGSDIASKVSTFRAFRTGLRDAFADFRGPHASIDVLLSWGTRNYASVPVAHHPRATGKSSYNFARLAGHAFDVLTGFSTRPLRFASLIGLATMLFGLGVLAFVLIRYLIEGGSVPGFPFLASVIAIFAGAQLLSLGIIGEYLARIHMRTMAKPAYSVRDEVGAAERARSSAPE